MSITQAAHNGMSARTALSIWGETLLRHGRSMPDNLGWPSASVEARLMEFGHGAKEPGRQPFLTRPEDAIDRLRSELAITEWVSAILREADPKHRVFALLYYKSGKCWADIAEAMNAEEPTTEGDVEKMARAVSARIRRGLEAIRRERSSCAA